MIRDPANDLNKLLRLLDLLNIPEQTAELKRLEQIVTSSGNQRIEASTGHDDRAVALALAAHEAVAAPVVEPWITTIRVNRADPHDFFDDDGRCWTQI